MVWIDCGKDIKLARKKLHHLGESGLGGSVKLWIEFIPSTTAHPDAAKLVVTDGKATKPEPPPIPDFEDVRAKAAEAAEAEKEGETDA